MFSCSHCDTQVLRWSGRCLECGKWGTLSEDGATALSSLSKKTSSSKPAQTLKLGDATGAMVSPVSTGLSELDRVLGGGIVPGSVTLLAGEPGIGKSTLVAQIATSFTSIPSRPEVATEGSDPHKRKSDPSLSLRMVTSYYASGEESEGQVRMRFERLGINPSTILFSNAVDVGAIVAAAKAEKPSIVIVDSIQTMMVAEADSFPGTPTAVRAATTELIGFAKSTGIPVLIIGQVTKEGSIAGPKTLEHLVDTVLTLEGDPDSAYRILRAEKHRFGSTEEIGVFEMTEKGLIAVENPSARFLKERVPGPGSVVTCIMAGSRPFLVEIQALVDKSFFPNPVRRTSGYDASRLQMLLAIISKRAGIKVYDQDVYVNVVGGIKIDEHAADLAVAAAIISAINEKTFPADMIILGELGLGGEVRSVPFLERRLKEAERLGMPASLTPKNTKHVKELGK
ncbi:MAG: ATPase domain-containing protein [Patescibacteria group bacterium]